MTSSLSPRNIEYIMYNVQNNILVHDNAVHLVVSEGWHFTHMWKTLAWTHHFATTRGGTSANKTSLTPPLFFEVPVPSDES